MSQKKRRLLLLGVGIFIAGFYTVAVWINEPARRSEYLEVNLLAHKVALAYLSALTSPESAEAKNALEESLKGALRHPHVQGAEVRNLFGEVVMEVHGEKSSNGAEFNLPVYGMNQNAVGSVSLRLQKPSFAFSFVGNRTHWYAGFGCLIGFLICFLASLRKDDFIPKLIRSLQQVGSGQLDAPLPTTNVEEYKPVLQAFNQLIEGLQERDRMRHSLGRIMDPKIAEILIKENPKVGGLRRQATILFCDIRNYTTICEQLSGDELQVFLNEYWKETVEIIMEQEGTIDKFHGDGVCVIFGAPNLHEDDPLRAVKTAWKLVENVARINQRREAQRKTPIQIGVGVHSGEVIAGHIGSERRMDYTVIGDVVNVAARIEELNKKFGTTILISDNVYEKVESFVRVKTITLAYLRGHKRPILVHALREFLEAPQQRQPSDKINEKAA